MRAREKQALAVSHTHSCFQLSAAPQANGSAAQELIVHFWKGTFWSHVSLCYFSFREGRAFPSHRCLRGIHPLFALYDLCIPPGASFGVLGAAGHPPPPPSSSYGCQTPSSLSLLFEAFLLRESPPHRANPVESKTCLAKTFLETACAHAPLHQCHYSFSSDQHQPRRCCQARKV